MTDEELAFEIVEEIDTDELLALYETHPWWEDRDPAGLEGAIDHTDLLLGLRAESGDIVAAARVLTDFVYYGKVYDVIVHEDRRGEGIGGWLMEAVTAHPALDRVDVLTLDCREGLVEFYERCGFERHEPTTDVAGEDEELVTMRYEADDG